MKTIIIAIIAALSVQLSLNAECVFKKFYITADNINFRLKPSDKSEIIKTLSRLKFGECLEKDSTLYSIHNKSNYYYKVKLEDNSVGWIFGDFIKFINKKPDSWEFLLKKAEITILNIQRFPFKPVSYTISTDNSKKFILARGTFYFSDGGDSFHFIWKIVDNDIKLIHTTGDYTEIIFNENYIIEYWPENYVRTFDLSNDNGLNILEQYLAGKYSSYSTMKMISEFFPASEMTDSGLPQNTKTKIDFNDSDSKFVVNFLSPENEKLKILQYEIKDGIIIPVN